MSSFYELKLTELTVENSKSIDTDFRGCDLSHSVITNTDLEKSQFNKTNLSSADLSGSVNYYINPIENNLKNTRVTLPEALNLLVQFGIKVEGLNDAS